MPLTKNQKAQAVDEIVELLEASPIVYLTDYAGLTVDQATRLRQEFRSSGVQFKVLKNTLVRLAMQRIGGFDDLLEQLHGPTAVAFSEEPAAAARVIKSFNKDNETEIPSLKGAYIDGAVYGSDALEVLASLKSKDEILSDIIGLLMAPITNVVGALEGQGATLVGAIKQIAEREES